MSTLMPDHRWKTPGGRPGLDRARGGVQGVLHRPIGTEPLVRPGVVDIPASPRRGQADGDRVDTVGLARTPASRRAPGATFGMGETDKGIVDLAFDLREVVDADSVPVNFLISFEGTPLQDEWGPTPQRCLRVLALFRYVFPTPKSVSPEAARSTS